MSQTDPRPVKPLGVSAQMSSTEALCLVWAITDVDPLDKWLLTAIANCGTLSTSPLARMTLMTEGEVIDRITRLSMETDYIDRLAARWLNGLVGRER